MKPATETYDPNPFYLSTLDALIRSYEDEHAAVTPPAAHRPYVPRRYASYNAYREDDLGAWLDRPFLPPRRPVERPLTARQERRRRERHWRGPERASREAYRAGVPFRWPGLSWLEQREAEGYRVICLKPAY